MKTNEYLPIAVLYGGRGAEHEISCRSADYLFSLLEEACLPFVGIKIDKSGGFTFDGTGLPTFPVRLGERRGFWKNGEILPVSCVFPVLHGDHGEDGELQGLLDSCGIPYLGCGCHTGALTSDKIAAKLLAGSAGIPTAPFCFSDSDDPSIAKAKAEETLSYPLFLKPNGLGSSIGASAADTPEEFASAYLAARAYGRVLIEEKMPIRAELELAYLGGDPPRFAGPGAVFCGSTFYSFSEKYENTSSARTEETPDLPGSALILCRSYGEKLVSLFGLRHLSRIDFFLLDDGRVIFNEINPFPGFTGISLFPKLWKSAGMSSRELIGHLFALATGEADSK